MSQPPLAVSLTPANPEQTICITSGLGASDKNCVDIPISQVPAYLKSHKECYERTQPTEKEPERKLNRAYIDLDGEVDKDMSEADFDSLVTELNRALLHGLSDRPYSVKSSCKWKCADDKGNVTNKLSYGIHFTNIAGSKKAIKAYILAKIAPKITSACKGFADVLSVVKKATKTDYTGKLIIDQSVWNDGQRKMRMLGQSKPLQDRPYKVLSGEFNDFLITYIPEGCEILPEPQSILTLTKVEETPEPPSDLASLADTNTEAPVTSDPTEDEEETRELILEVIDRLGVHRLDYYPDWIRLAFVMFNEGFQSGDCIKACKRSKYYTQYGETEFSNWIKSKWRNFRKSNLTQCLLWKWLQEDNPDAYAELALRRMDFQTLIKNPSHAEVARFFFNLKPDGYLFNERLGWFQLLPSNVWKHYDKHPNSLLPDIWHTLKKPVSEAKAQIKMECVNEDEQKMELLKLKRILAFTAKIGNKSFCDGVIAFLPSCFNDDDLDKKMDEKRHLLAFSDMVYDLEKHEPRLIQPDDYICLNTGFPYPVKRFPEARAELVKTIRSVFEAKMDIEASPDVLGALTTYVLKSLALTLHGRKKHEKFFVWTGTGGNGKGLIAELVKRALGDYYHTVPHQCLTKGQDKKDATNPPLAKAKGKRAVFASEPEADDSLQVGAIKEWSGGDPVSARDLYRSTVTFVPQFVLFLQTNLIPKLNRPDGGIQRRLEVIEFPYQFVDKPTEPHHKKLNIDLKEKIVKSQEWRDEMVHLLLDSYKLLERDGLEVPTEVQNKSKEYMDSNNPLKEWLEANFTTGLSITDRRFMIESSKMRDQFIQQTKQEIGADKFKASMESLGVKLKKEGHDFRCLSYISENVSGQWSSRWELADRKAGKYWCGLKKAKAPMPPETGYAFEE